MESHVRFLSRLPVPTDRTVQNALIQFHHYLSVIFTILIDGIQNKRLWLCGSEYIVMVHKVSSRLKCLQNPMKKCIQNNTAIFPF